jgi:hypothetical protein
LAVVRSAIVAAFAETNPALASRIWPGHPASELWLGLTEIGLASRNHEAVSQSTKLKIRDAARKSPLDAEPFLVRGVEAQIGGNEQLASEAFLAAKLRDGRSIPARYFLAEHYFRGGDAKHALEEIAFLARGVPNGVARLAPYVGIYAKDRRNWPQLRSVFRSDPSLADATLAALATDARNADLVLSLADRSSVNPRSEWPPRMVQSLITAGEYPRAHTLWSKIAHASRATGPIYDPDFRDSAAPPPFNWALTSSTVGLAERRKGGGLHTIFYGQEDGVLASQLLVLSPGNYRLSMNVSGDAARMKALAWTLKCDNSKISIASLPLDPAAAARGWPITVPAGCPAQLLELAATGSDLPQQTDVTITNLKMERLNG